MSVDRSRSPCSAPSCAALAGLLRARADRPDPGAGRRAGAPTSRTPDVRRGRRAARAGLAGVPSSAGRRRRARRRRDRAGLAAALPAAAGAGRRSRWPSSTCTPTCCRPRSSGRRSRVHGRRSAAVAAVPTATAARSSGPLIGGAVVFGFFYALWWVYPAGHGVRRRPAVRRSLGFVLGYLGWAELADRGVRRLPGRSRCSASCSRVVTPGPVGAAHAVARSGRSCWSGRSSGWSSGGPLWGHLVAG